MELKCPNCGEVILAENINIQEMVALCGACHHVFEFRRSTVARKAKRRIPRQPERVHLHVDEGFLELSYQFVLGSGPMFGLVMATVGVVVSTLLIINAYATGEPTSLLFFLGAMTLICTYLFATLVTTTTTISMDDKDLNVSSGPLPFPIRDDKTLGIAEIARITFEETRESNSPLPPSYNVYAELLDGARISVVTSLPRLHAHYIARVLDDHLQEEKEVAVTEAGEQVIDDTVQAMLEADAPEYRHYEST